MVVLQAIALLLRMFASIPLRASFPVDPLMLNADKKITTYLDHVRGSSINEESIYGTQNSGRRRSGMETRFYTLGLIC